MASGRWLPGVCSGVLYGFKGVMCLQYDVLDVSHMTRKCNMVCIMCNLFIVITEILF